MGEMRGQLDEMARTIDFPTAWEIAGRVSPEYHHNRCSYSVTSRAMLCDCAVLTESPEYLAAYGASPGKPAGDADA